LAATRKIARKGIKLSPLKETNNCVGNLAVGR